MILSPQIASNGYKWMLISTATAIAGFSFGTWVLASILPKTLQLILTPTNTIGLNTWVYDANLSVTNSFWSNLIIAIPWVIAFLVITRVIVGFVILLMRTKGFTRANGELQARLSVLSAKAGVSVPKLFVGKTTGVAFSTLGSIYLSNDLVEMLPPEKLDVVLAHEIAHITRGDQISRWCQMIITSMSLIMPSNFFWQRYEFEVEKQADTMAVSLSGDSMIVAETLVSCAKFLRTQPCVSNLSHIDLLTKRVKSLIGEMKKPWNVDWFAFTIILMLNLFLIIPSVKAYTPNIDGLTEEQVISLMDGEMAALIYKPYCMDEYDIQLVPKSEVDNLKQPKGCTENCSTRSHTRKMEVHKKW